MVSLMWLMWNLRAGSRPTDGPDKQDAHRIWSGGRRRACARPCRAIWWCLDHPAAGPRAAGERIPRHDHDHGTDDGGDDRAEIERPVDGVGVEQDAGEEPANEGAH